MTTYHVLLVEENKLVSDELKIYLEQQLRKIEVIQAFDLLQGQAMLEFHSQEFLCSVLGEGVSTVPLAREMKKKGFPIILISFSGNPDLQKQQMKYCTHQFKKTELNEMRDLIEILIPSSKK